MGGDGTMQGKDSSDGGSRLKAFLNVAKEAISKVGNPLIADLAQGFLRVDPDQKTLSIADSILLPGLNKLANALAPQSAITVEARPSGFQVGAKMKGKRASALLELEQLVFAKGEVTVRVRTPEGVRVENGSLSQVFAALVARFFGGSWLGKKVFASHVPPGVTWDGTVATLTVDLLKQGPSATALAALEAEARVFRSDGWTTFVLDKTAGLQLLQAYLARTISKLVPRDSEADPESK
jgi:hypothetical protein